MNLSKDALDTIVALAETNTPMTIVKLVQFVDAMTKEKKTELMALMRLGRDGGDFLEHLASAEEEADDNVGYYMAEQGTELATYIRRGIAQKQACEGWG